MPLLTINGRRCEADEGATVLAVARQEGIAIPTLCYHEALGPYGACRLCVVEAEGPMLRRTLTTSCTLPATEGLQVDTETGLVARSRSIILELLIARAPDVPMLRDMAARFNVRPGRFAPWASDDCVRCGRCVRVCRDKIGVSAITFAGRGQTRRVTAEFGALSESCIGCGACANVCPTGAIRMEDKGGERKISLWGTIISRQELVRCASCGVPFATARFLDSIAERTKDVPRADGRRWCGECARRHGAEDLPGAGAWHSR